jgi:hypothetical protein
VHVEGRDGMKAMAKPGRERRSMTTNSWGQDRKPADNQCSMGRARPFGVRNSADSNSSTWGLA